MVGSSAVVGWAANGRGTVKQYYLGGKSPEECAPNRGLLKLVRNRTAVASRSGRLYLAFQLSTDYPQPYLIYAVGPDGSLPQSDSLRLPAHQNMASRSFNYTSGTSPAPGPRINPRGFYIFFSPPPVCVCVCVSNRQMRACAQGCRTTSPGPATPRSRRRGSTGCWA
jgi:hypothetical protein